MPIIRAAPVKRVSATRVASMKRFWSDELQDEISRLTGLCVQQQDYIIELEKSRNQWKESAIERATRNGKLIVRNATLVEMIEVLWQWSPISNDEKLKNIEARDPKIAKVVGDFIQREACGMREEIVGVCISDSVNSTIVDLSSDHT